MLVFLCLFTQFLVTVTLMRFLIGLRHVKKATIMNVCTDVVTSSNVNVCCPLVQSVVVINRYKSYVLVDYMFLYWCMFMQNKRHD